MTGFRHAAIMSRILNTPLLAHPTKALVFYNALCGRFGTGPMPISPAMPDIDQVQALRRRDVVAEALTRGGPEASRFVGAWPQSEEGGRIEPFRLTKEGVGVITITGSLVNRGAWIGSNSGETSYEGIKHQLARAGADSRVKSVILDMETPGGEAVGAFEAGAAVRSLAEKKPVIAVGNGMAASAGYAIAAGATKIINTPTGVLGSIGVLMLHLDYSKALEQEGIAPTFIFAGSRKVDGNPFEPLTDNVKEELQAEVIQFYDLFVETVAQGRGRRTSAKAARETEARTYIGKSAVDARLADDVGTFDEVLADLSRRAPRSASGGSGAKAEATRSPNMNPMEDIGAVAQEQLDASRQAGRVEGEAAGRTAGAEAERTRLLAVLNHTESAGRERFALQLALESPGLQAEAVGRLCASVPKAAPEPAKDPRVASDGRPPIGQRNEADTGANRISSAPTGKAPDGGNEQAPSWDAAVNSANERLVSNHPKSKHLART